MQHKNDTNIFNIYNLKILSENIKDTSPQLKIINFEINNPELYYKFSKYNARILYPKSWNYINTIIIKEIKNYMLFAINIAYIVELIYNSDLKALRLLLHNSKYISNRTRVCIINDLNLDLLKLNSILYFTNLKYEILNNSDFFLQQYARI